MQRQVVLYKLQFGKLCFSKKKKNKIKIKKNCWCYSTFKKIWKLQLSPCYKLTFVTKFKTGFTEITCGSLSEVLKEESSLG